MKGTILACLIEEFEKQNCTVDYLASPSSKHGVEMAIRAATIRECESFRVPGRFLRKRYEGVGGYTEEDLK